MRRDANPGAAVMPRAVLAATLLLLGGIGACTCNPKSVNRGDVNLVGLDEEWQMGRELAAEVEQQLTLVDDPVVNAFVERLGRRLVERTELAGRPWHFHVVADPSLNAFAIPGGHVYVNTGLIAAASRVDELAGVMAHEVGHGVSRHSTERLTKVHGLNLVAGLLLGDSPGLLQQIAAQLIGSGAVAKFSRDDEREADRLGLRFMNRAGYDPTAMATMFERLLAQRERRPNVVERFFASHPLTEERIADVRQAARDLPPPDAAAPLAEDFGRVQQRLPYGD